MRNILNWVNSCVKLECEIFLDWMNSSVKLECETLKGHCIEFKYYADGIHSGLTPPG